MINKMCLLAFCFSLYHAITHDDGCIGAEGVLQCPGVMKSGDIALARSVKQFVSMPVSKGVHTTSLSDVTWDLLC